jgi:hypothetical protein
MRVDALRYINRWNHVVRPLSIIRIIVSAADSALFRYAHTGLADGLTLIL